MIVHVRFIGSPLGTDSSLGQPNTPKNLIPMSSEFGNGQDFEHSKIIVFGCSGECDFGLDSRHLGKMFECAFGRARDIVLEFLPAFHSGEIEGDAEHAPRTHFGRVGGQVRQIHGQVPACGDVLGRGANAKIHGGALLVSFPKAVFFERLRNPDQLDGTGDAFACGKLHEERQLEFEAALAGAGCLSKSDYAKHGASSKFPRPMKRGDHSP
jgi:hypothetical protein